MNALQDLIENHETLGTDVEPFLADLEKRYGISRAKALVAVWGWLAGELVIQHRVPRQDLVDMLDRASTIYGQIAKPVAKG